MYFIENCPHRNIFREKLVQTIFKANISVYKIFSRIKTCKKSFVGKILFRKISEKNLLFKTFSENNLIVKIFRKKIIFKKFQKKIIAENFRRKKFRRAIICKHFQLKMSSQEKIWDKKNSRNNLFSEFSTNYFFSKYFLEFKFSLKFFIRIIFFTINFSPNCNNKYVIINYIIINYLQKIFGEKFICRKFSKKKIILGIRRKIICIKIFQRKFKF